MLLFHLEAKLNFRETVIIFSGVLFFFDIVSLWSQSLYYLVLICLDLDWFGLDDNTTSSISLLAIRRCALVTHWATTNKVLEFR